MAKPKPPGLLITFEGTEGTGKSTLIEAFERLLAKNKISFLRTREPGGTALGESLRDLILNEDMDPVCELFLYEASRAEHVASRIAPALAKGQWVVCDRFTDSTLAYQAHARGLNWKTVEQLNLIATSGKKPDLTVWLNGDPAYHLKKAKVMTRFEREGIAFQKKVRAGFERARAADPKRWIVLKAFSETPERLADQVLARATIEARKRVRRGS